MIKRGNVCPAMHAGRMSGEKKDRDWGNTSTNQGKLRIASQNPETRTGTNSFSQSSEGTNAVDTLISGC
jgi:hypothetical protein